MKKPNSEILTPESIKPRLIVAPGTKWYFGWPICETIVFGFDEQYITRHRYPIARRCWINDLQVNDTAYRLFRDKMHSRRRPRTPRPKRHEGRRMAIDEAVRRGAKREGLAGIPRRRTLGSS